MYIAEEVQIEILTRLPVKSLLRFIAVSKSWRFIITSPAFISAHRNNANSSSSATNQLLFLPSLDASWKHKYSILNDSTHHQMLITLSQLECPITCDNFRVCLRLVGCRNGVVCLCSDSQHDGDAITLWNPSIRMFRMLRYPSIWSTGSYRSVLGFGVGGNNPLDLKVVRIVYQRNNKPAFKIPPEVEVYSLNTDLWRRITPTGVNYFIFSSQHQPFVNGALHWIASYNLVNDHHNLQGTLIAFFNMANELFGEIRLPDELARECPSKLSIRLFQEESILVANYIHGGLCELWVMKQYGVVESWTRLHSIQLLLGTNILKVFGFRKNGQVLFSTTANEGLFSYCPNTRFVNDLGIISDASRFYVDKYVESLVLLQPPNPLVDDRASSLALKT